MRNCIVSPLLVALLLASPLPGRAAEEAAPVSKEIKKNAKRHYDSGVKFYSAGAFEAAREEFEEAYRLLPLPDMLFNLGRVHERLERVPEAISYLERYLEARPNAPDVSSVQTLLDKLRAQLPKVEPKEEPKAAPVPPAPAPLAPPSLPPPPPPRTGPALWPGLVFLGTGAALLGVGAGLGATALSAQRQVANPANSGRYFDADLQAAERRGQTLSTTALALYVVGGVALAGGAAWTGYWLYRRSQGDKVRVSLAPGPGALGLALLGSF